MRSIVSWAGVLSVAAVLAAPIPVQAQSANANEASARRAANALLRQMPNRVVPTPPGRNADWTPPGLGGVIPGLGRGRGNDGDAGGELRRIPRPCAPGGALSGTIENGQIGRNHARGRVCGG